jgi:hypothetical protein
LEENEEVSVGEMASEREICLQVARNSRDEKVNGSNSLRRQLIRQVRPSQVRNIPKSPQYQQSQGQSLDRLSLKVQMKLWQKDHDPDTKRQHPKGPRRHILARIHAVTEKAADPLIETMAVYELGVADAWDRRIVCCVDRQRPARQRIA